MYPDIAITGLLYAGTRNFATWKKPQQAGYLGHGSNRLHEAFDPAFPSGTATTDYRNFHETLSIRSPL